MELDYKKIGKRIKDARKKKGYTQDKLASVTGISIAHIGHVETGYTKVSLPGLVKIANALDTSLDALLYDSTCVSVESYDKDLKDLIADCSEDQKEFIVEAVKMIKKGFNIN